MYSIIIPAHNEENVIVKNIKSFYNLLYSENFECIVVCNGCVDNTAELVRENFPLITVIEIKESSKTNAINKGDCLARGSVKIYLDADIKINVCALTNLAKFLQYKEHAATAAPRLKIRLCNVSMLIKFYYYFWLNVPYLTEGIIGSGVYALNELGRRRFEELPEIIADDSFVRLHFNRTERFTLKDDFFIVSPPKYVHELIRVKTRSRLGNLELIKKRNDLQKNDETDYCKFIWKILLRPDLWISGFVYFSIRFIIMRNAKNRLRNNNYYWEKDNSSRV